MIGRKGGRKTEVHWDIDPVNDTKSKLTIRLLIPHLQKSPTIIRWFPHFLYLRPNMKKYLNSVVGGYDYYITTGEAVHKDQFGTHPWFSTKP